MNIVIFAGGVGTRLWPLSRKKTPKQFEKIIGDKSTLELVYKRITSSFSPGDIYISTNKRYISMVSEQLPEIPKEHIIGEPEMRDVGPAVGLLTAMLSKLEPDTPMAILWSDHLVRKEELFCSILKSAEKMVKKENNKIIFIAQKPRFANKNLGWIHFGGVEKILDGVAFRSLKGFKYQPDEKTARNYFEKNTYAWNLGYFVTTPRFLFSKYKQFVPDMYKSLKILQKHIGKSSWSRILKKIYPTLEKISFDNAILEKLSKKEAYVISEDLGWSDVGTWEALKEALEKSKNENVTQGKVYLSDCNDCLIYNYNNKQLIVSIDLEELLVVNTNDVLLICKKDSVGKIKSLVKSFSGTQFEHLT